MDWDDVAAMDADTWDSVAEFDQSSPQAVMLGQALTAARKDPELRPQLANRIAWFSQAVPFSPVGIKRDVNTLSAANRIKDGSAKPVDYLLVADHLLRAEESGDRSFGGQVLDVLIQIPGFAGEVAATGGAFRGGKAITQKVVGEAAETLAGKAIQATIPRAVGVAAQTAANPQLVARNTAQRMMPAMTPSVDAQGNVVSVDIGDDQQLLQSLAAGFADSAIELGSERAGGHLAKVAGRLASFIPGSEKLRALKAAISQKWLAAKPGRTFAMLDEALKQGGWHGVTGELMEERAGDVARLVTGLEGFEDNLTGQATSGAAMAGYGTISGDQAMRQEGVARLGQAGRQLGVEAVAFSVPGAIQVGARGLEAMQRADRMPDVQAQRQQRQQQEFDAEQSNRQAEAILQDPAAVQGVVQTASSIRGADKVQAAINHPTRDNWEAAALPPMRGELRKRFAERARGFLQPQEQANVAPPVAGDESTLADAGPIGPAESGEAPQAGPPTQPQSGPPAGTQAGTQQPIDEALSFVRQSWGEEWTVEQPETEDEREAAAFVAQYEDESGRVLTPVFFSAKDGVQPGMTWKKSGHVFLKKGRGGDALWSVVGDEVAHGIGLDLKDFADDALVAEARNEYLAAVKAAAPRRLKALEDNPDLLDREAKAHLVAKFMEQKEFRDKLLNTNPTLWERIVELVERVVGSFNPRSKAKQAVLAELRQKRKEISREREKQGSSQGSPGSQHPGPADVQGPRGGGESRGPDAGQAEGEQGQINQPGGTSPPAATTTQTQEQPDARQEVQGQAEGEVAPSPQSEASPEPAAPATAGKGGLERIADLSEEELLGEVLEETGLKKPAPTAKPAGRAKKPKGPLITSIQSPDLDADDLAARKPRVRELVGERNRTGKVIGRGSQSRVIVKFDDGSELGVPVRQLEELPEEATKQPAPKPAADQEIADVFDEFSALGAAPQPADIEAERARVAVKVALTLVKKGTTRFTDVVRLAVQHMGAEKTATLGKYLQSAWRRLKMRVGDAIDDPGDVGAILKELSDAARDPGSGRDAGVADGSGQSEADAAAAGVGVAEDAQQAEGTGEAASDRPLRDDGATAAGQPQSEGGGAAGTGTAGTSGAGQPELAGSGTADSGAKGPTPAAQQAAALNDQNHVIDASDELATSGLKTSLRRNLAALDLLKRLEDANRQATPEEKKVLAQFSGWGGLSQVFDEYAGRIMLTAAEGSWKRNDAKQQSWEKEWGDAYRRVKELMTEEEWIAARDTTINAHFTSRTVIEQMWDLVERLGFSGGRVLEPGAGIGHFAGLAPKRFRGSEFVLVERDSISARLLKKLYPRADVRHTAMEDFRISPGSVDLAIGNVPFAKTGPADAAKRYGQDLNLHNYMIARSLDALRPGGIAVLISTHHTLDSSVEQRKILASKAQLLGAIRLPNTAFAENAKTEVVTDILVFRRPMGAEKLGEPFEQVKELKLTGGSARVNEYFVAHPEMVLGTQSLAGTMYGKNEYTVQPNAATSLGDQVAAAIDKLPAGVIGEGQATEPITSELEGDEAREGTVRMHQGKPQMAVNGQWVTLSPGKPIEGYSRLLTTPAGLARLKDYVGVRDTYRELRQVMMRDDATDKQIKEAQAKLEKVYDAYTKRHGHLNARKTDIFEMDPEYYRVLSLEDGKSLYDPASDKVTVIYRKASVFTTRTIGPKIPPTSVPSVKDGMWVSLGYRGSIDTEYIAQLAGKSKLEVAHTLSAEGLAFRDPESQTWHTAEHYLSGNVREKLRLAKIAAEDDAEYEANVQALEKAQPERVPITKVTARLGANWIPEEAIQTFATRLFGTASVRYDKVNDRWHVSVPQGNTASENKWAAVGRHRTVTGGKIFEDALNLRSTEIRVNLGTDKEPVWVNDEQGEQIAKTKQKQMQDEFRKLIDSNDDIAALLEERYNAEKNAFVDPKYNGSHLELPGSSPDIRLRPYQKNAIWRILQDGYALLAHAVGAGKTFTMIGAAMEMRRLGLAKRPMLVVQNATLGQFANSFMKMYPNANVLVASKDDLTEANRQLFLNRITSGDWDAIVMAQSTFERLNMSPAAQVKFVHDKLMELEDAIHEARAAGDSVTVKDLVKARDALKKQLDKMLHSANRQGEKNRLAFEQVEVDALFLDEAHAYKKPFFLTKLKKLVGLNTQISNRGVTTMMKVAHVQGKNKGRNVVLATGTPITNTLGEAWHMMNFVAPQVNRAYGIHTFDGFVGAFAVKDTVREMNAGGKWVFKDALIKFTNGPELMHWLRSAWDILSPDDLRAYMDQNDLNLPKLKGGKVQSVTVPISPGVQKVMDFIKDVYARFQSLAGKEKRMFSWIPAVAYGAARAAALDIRLVNQRAKEEPGTKFDKAASLIYEEYVRSSDRSGAQLVFSDTFNPRDMTTLRAFMGGQSIGLELADESAAAEEAEKELARQNEAFLFNKLKTKLVSMGIPANQIALVAEAKTDPQRAALFERVKSGDVRVMMGSSARMGVGVNVQDKLVALHHLDSPWLPADLEQREGRILRFGNENREVSIYRYGMTRTLDGAIMSKTVRKAKFIWQVMAGKLEGREFDDPASETTLSMEEQLAAIQDDPLFFEKLDLDRLKRELELEREGFGDSVSRAREQAKQNRYEVARYKRDTIPLQKERIKEAEAIDVSSPELKIEGKTYTDLKEADAALKSLIDQREIDILKRTKDDELPHHGPSHWRPAPSDEFLVPMRLNTYRVVLDTGASLNWANRQLVADSLFNIYLPSGGTSLYEGDAKTATGLFEAVQRLPAKLRAALEGMEQRVEHLEKEAVELDEIAAQVWDKQAELDRVRTRLDEVDRLLVEKSKKEAAEEEERRKKKDKPPEDDADAHGAAPEIPKHPNAAVEERLQAARGVRRPSFLARLKDTLRRLLHIATRPYEHLPNEAKFAPAQEFFRLLKELAGSSLDRANRMIESATSHLEGDADLQLFERKLIADNAIASYQRGEGLRFASEKIEEWEQHVKDLDAVIADNPRVQRALLARKQMVTDVVSELVRWDLLPEGAIERADTYYHQQVLMYRELMRRGGGGSTPRMVKHSYRKSRVEGKNLSDPKYDYNTSYLEAETAWLSKALADLDKQRRLKMLADTYDERKRLYKQAEARNFENLVGGKDVVERILELRQAIPDLDGDEKGEALAELMSLDPTFDIRARIARASAKLAKMGAIQDDKMDLEVMDEDAAYFQQVAAIARDEEHEGNLWAKSLLKAISERRQLYQEKLGPKYATWETLLHERDDLDAWQPVEGNYFYPALTITEEIGAALQKGLLDRVEISKDNLREVLAMGGKKKTYVFPVELAEQLDAAANPAVKGWLQTGAEEWTKALKLWLIMRPDNYLAYNARNMLGDTDAVLGGMAPGVLKIAANRQTWEELKGYYYGREKLSAALEQARDLGVLDAGVSAQEIPDFEQAEMFRRFYAIEDWGQRVKWFVEKLKEPVKWARFRESLLRYAAFKYYKQKLASGTLEHAGGTRMDWVLKLRQHYGDEVAAAHLSRNLLGDYGNLTVMGDWLKRTLVPFWSFTEINLKRYPRYLLNAVEYAKLKAAKGDGAKAMYLGQALGSMVGLTAAAIAWNLIFFGDDEDDLLLADRNSPHILLGKRSDGTIRILRNTSALGEFTEVLGLNGLLALFPKWQSGQLSTGDLVKETAMGPVNTLAQGIRPDVKLPVELALGASFYPDVRRPRAQARDELAAEAFAIGDPYRAAKGVVMQDGSRARKHYWERLATGGVSATVDPRKNALGEIHEARNAFKKSKGLAVESIWRVSKYKRLRDAAEAEDYESFQAARRKFIASGGTFEGYIASLRMIDPVESRLSNKLEEEFVGEFLTDLQRGKLRVARDYADQISTRMLGWWYDAAGEDPPEMRQALYQATHKTRQRLRDRLRWKFQAKRQKGETAAEYHERRRNWMEERRSAAERLHRLTAAMN